MSINIPPNKRRDTLLRMAIGELSDWHLMVLCAQCRQDRVVSINSLIERFGEAVTLMRLLPKFRCGMGRCRDKPSLVRLRNRMPVHPGPPLIEVTLLDARPRNAPAKPGCASPAASRKHVF